MIKVSLLNGDRWKHFTVRGTLADATKNVVDNWDAETRAAMFRDERKWFVGGVHRKDGKLVYRHPFGRTVPVGGGR